MKLEKGADASSFVQEPAFDVHADDSTLHLTESEHRDLQRLSELFPPVDPDAPPVPEAGGVVGAISNEAISKYFSINAQPGVIATPSTVYVSRVLLAYKNEAGTAWVNTQSIFDEEVFGVSRKFMDNKGLVHACSTDTVEGVDDYAGLWSFFWQHGNYKTSEYGTKYVTAIKGQTIEGSTFDEKANICAFGPAFWFFCKEEKYQDKDTGMWLTHDKTETGHPLFQLWGISSRSWSGLDEERRAGLLAHGITEDDFHIWPECLAYDYESDSMVERPYWIHSAYCGGYEKDTAGATHLVSKKNAPLYNNLSHNAIAALYGNKGGFGGSACVNGFGVLFDIVKNATKNSQSIHYGMASNNQNAVIAAHATKEAGYVFPIASRGNFDVGGTVKLWQSNTGSTISNFYNRSITTQIGRITAIETREITLVDDTTASSLCLVIDPETVEPFLVRTTVDETKALTDAGTYACCYATQGMALGGETDGVIGKHDGSMTSLTNGRHPYRVQGTEFMPGIWMCAPDVVVIKGDGATEVTVDGVTSTPTSSNYVYLQGGVNVAVKTSGTLSAYIDGGYKPIGVSSCVTSSVYILNTQMSSTGVVYPTAAGGTGSSASTGHADIYYCGASPAEFLSGGRLVDGASAGSAFLSLDVGLGDASWHFGARA